MRKLQGLHGGAKYKAWTGITAFRKQMQCKYLERINEQDYDVLRRAVKRRGLLAASH